MSQPPVYVPIGHGEEDITGKKPVMPAGCQLVVLAQCKRPVEISRIGENAEHLNIKKFIAENPYRVDIFADPVNNRRAINKAIGSVCAFYKTGDEYPNIFYSLNLSWLKHSMVQYSGVIPFTTYISDEEETGFTTRNIWEKVYPRPDLDQYFEDPRPREIYKYSLFPRPEELPTADSTKHEMINYLLKTKTNKGVSPTLESLQALSTKELYKEIIGWTYKYERIENVRLSTLMAQMPGVYYHLFCRGDNWDNYRLPPGSDIHWRRRNSFVKHRLPGLTKDEIFNEIRKPPTESSTPFRAQFKYKNVAHIVGPYDELPPNIKESFEFSEPRLTREKFWKRWATWWGLKGGRRRTYKQGGRKRKTRKTRG